MSKNEFQHLPELLSAAVAINEETRAVFGDLTEAQLNWKPSAEQWSVGQCFDHLLTTNSAYFPIFEEIRSGEKKKTFWESLPLLPKLWGNLLINAVAPQTARKMKAPKIFQPSTSEIDGTIIQRFTDQQDQLISYMKAIEGIDLERFNITSPVNDVITYSLMDAYRIIINHDRRHFLQAQRVTEANGFPSAAHLTA